MRIAWWRVALLAAVTVAAGTGAWIQLSPAFRTGPSPSPAAATPVSRGPLPGDLGPLPIVTPTPPPTPAPPAPAARKSSTGRTRPRTPAPNPFRDLPGAGPLEDLCRTGRCP